MVTVSDRQAHRRTHRETERKREEERGERERERARERERERLNMVGTPSIRFVGFFAVSPQRPEGQTQARPHARAITHRHTQRHRHIHTHRIHGTSMYFPSTLSARSSPPSALVILNTYILGIKARLRPRRLRNVQAPRWGTCNYMRARAHTLVHGIVRPHAFWRLEALRFSRSFSYSPSANQMTGRDASHSYIYSSYPYICCGKYFAVNKQQHYRGAWPTYHPAPSEIFFPCCLRTIILFLSIPLSLSYNLPLSLYPPLPLLFPLYAILCPSIPPSVPPSFFRLSLSLSLSRLFLLPPCTLLSLYLPFFPRCSYSLLFFSFSRLSLPPSACVRFCVDAYVRNLRMSLIWVPWICACGTGEQGTFRP